MQNYRISKEADVIIKLKLFMVLFLGAAVFIFSETMPSINSGQTRTEVVTELGYPDASYVSGKKIQGQRLEHMLYYSEDWCYIVSLGDDVVTSASGMLEFVREYTEFSAPE